MATRKWTLWLSAGMTSLLVACGGGGTTNVQNAPPANPPTVAIAFAPTPPASLFINATTGLTAVVKNDSSNAGVDWSLTCQNSGNCGSLSPLHTSSGQAATYVPPAGLTTNTITVSIVAFATMDHTKNIVAPLTVNAFGSILKGTYVLRTSGVDISGAYQFAGVVVLDGNGAVTSGEQTINYVDPTSGSYVSVSDPITGGTYFVGPDGRGTISINTADQNIGQKGVEDFSLAVLSSSQVLIAKIDDLNLEQTVGTAGETSVGTMDLQTSKAAPSSGYAFVVNGTDDTFSPMVFGGVMNIDSPKTISGAGSVADQDLAGSVFTSASLSGTLSDPDSFGAVKFTLTASFAPTPIQLTGYIVDATHIRLIESDNSAGTGFGSTAGVAIGQGSATGTFTDNASFSGSYVFGVFGQDLSGLPSSLASVGEFTANGLEHLIRGYDNEFFGGLFVPIDDRFTGTYTVDPTGSGRVDSFITFDDPKNGAGPEFIFYLTGNGNPPLILDADSNGQGGIGVGGGAAYPAAASPSFSGAYGVSYTQSLFGTENDATGQMTPNTTADTVSGVVDTNFSFSPALNTPLTGTFNPPTTSGRFSGTLSNENFLAGSPMLVEFYLIDSGHGFFIETDSSTTGNLSYGYFATRTPVCNGCP